MPVDAAAQGGPALRAAWESAQLRPAELAVALGVSRASLYKWASPGERVPPAQVAAVDAQLREASGRRERNREDVLALIAAAAAVGRGLTRTELRKARRAGDTDELLEELRAGTLPLVHVRSVDARDEQGRTYVREELHPGAGDAPGAPEEGDGAGDLAPAILRGLRLYAGHSIEGMARRYGCRRQQLQAWEGGREQVPLGRRGDVRRQLAAAVERVQLRQRREEVGLKQNNLARRAGMPPPLLSGAETGQGRRLRWGELAAIGHVLDEAKRAAAAELDTAVDQLVALVEDAEPHGLTMARLVQVRGRGRPQGQSGVRAHDQLVLDAALARRRVQWLISPDVHGRQGLSARRLHTAGHSPAAVEVLDAAELRRLLDEATVSASELGRAIGVSFGSVARWLRGERRIPTTNTAAIRTALAELTSRPRRDPAAELLAAAHATSGLPSWRLFQEAGYGKSNAAAAAALEQLCAAGQVHLEPRPNHSRVVVPGPARDVPTRMAGDELRRRRREAGLRQRDLAAAVGVNQTAVAGWERAGLPAERRTSVEDLLHPTA